MTKPIKRKASSPERDGINAVMILYAVITMVMLAIHYWQLTA